MSIQLHYYPFQKHSFVYLYEMKPQALNKHYSHKRITNNHQLNKYNIR